MIQALTFAVVSAFFCSVSRQALLRPRSHGFYRFFAWECILALVLLNIPYWTRTPLALHQLISWPLLLVSIFLVIHGLYLLRVVGKPNGNRTDAELLAFEKTSCLVTVGAYQYIRHPLIASLLFLAWGAFCKRPSTTGLSLALLASLFLFLAAKKEESECLQYFGAAYQTYMVGTKRFIPFIL